MAALIELRPRTEGRLPDRHGRAVLAGGGDDGDGPDRRGVEPVERGRRTPLGRLGNGYCRSTQGSQPR